MPYATVEYKSPCFVTHCIKYVMYELESRCSNLFSLFSRVHNHDEQQLTRSQKQC